VQHLGSCVYYNDGPACPDLVWQRLHEAHSVILLHSDADNAKPDQDMQVRNCSIHRHAMCGCSYHLVQGTCIADGTGGGEAMQEALGRGGGGGCLLPW